MDGDNPATVVLIARTAMMDVVPTPGYAGTIQVHCAEPELAFDPAEVTLAGPDLEDPDGRHAFTTRTLNNAATVSEPGEWTFTLDEDIPDWLAITPEMVDYRLRSPEPGSRDVSARLRVDVDCKAHAEKVTFTGTARMVDSRLTEPLTAPLTVTAACNGYLEWRGPNDEPTEQGPGPFTASVTITLDLLTNGPTETTWTVAGVGNPDPVMGNLSAHSRSTIHSVVEVPDNREVTCFPQAAFDRRLSVTVPGPGVVARHEYTGHRITGPINPTGITGITAVTADVAGRYLVSLLLPDEAASVALTALNESGYPINGGYGSGTVPVGPDGHFSHLQALPFGAGAVQVTVVPTGQNAGATTTITLTGESRYHVTWDAIAPLIGVAGTLTWGGAPVAGPRAARAVERDPGGVERRRAHRLGLRAPLGAWRAGRESQSGRSGPRAGR